MREITLKTIGFIGAGQMAKSLAVGIANCSPSELQFFISDPDDSACRSFQDLIADRSSVSRAKDNQSLVDSCALVFLAVPPPYLDCALENVNFNNDPLVVSIVAGAQLYRLERLTGTNRIIRVMPNTPCLINKGASAITAGTAIESKDIE